MGIYVIGGRNGDNEILQSVEFLGKNHLQDSFAFAAPLPLEMEGLSASVINEQIYVSGTVLKTQSSEILLYDGKTWNPAGKLLSPRHSPNGNRQN